MQKRWCVTESQSEETNEIRNKVVIFKRNKKMDKPEKNKNVDFESLVKHIQTASEALQQDARLVINRNVTTRAWLTGFYIVEYEQHGNDRAKYGDKLLRNWQKG